MSIFNQSQTEKIIAFALEAGEIAVKFFKEKNFAIERKSDNSKVTSADIAVSKFLYESLSKEFPQIPIICEEGELRNFEEETFFLIDPIDGTSSFVSGSVEFAVCIAVIKNKKAVFGLIYAPLFEDGKMIYSDASDQVISRNLSGKEKILKTSSSSSPSDSMMTNELRIITSPRTKDADVEIYISQFHKNFLQNFSVEKLSSAIKFFRLLESDADLYLHLRDSMEWDVAAGQALVELMNGKVKNLFFNHLKSEVGEDLFYKKPNFENKSFIAYLTSNI